IAEANLGPAVSHDSYLINLASPKAETHGKSVALMVDEIERCEALGIGYLVAHPGAHTGSGEEAALEKIARSLDQIHRDLPGYQTITCLEITAGQGTNVGYRLEHLHQIIDRVTEPQRLGVCLDSAHALAAGYDLTSREGAEAFCQQVEAVLGLERVCVWHLNDSKVPLGSRVDRHEHIGHGHLSLEAFEVIVNHPAFLQKPKILETPKQTAPDGRPWDTVNLETLRGLMH
ncbi:MAG: deoxyribonuclease IV, partial [Phycisphaeraceae bacterium]|nr:deoxyribonuclease IV [Phycisphaeraceae bacterium]